jgi:hypothetical protein
LLNKMGDVFTYSFLRVHFGRPSGSALRSVSR